MKRNRADTPESHTSPSSRRPTIRARPSFLTRATLTTLKSDLYPHILAHLVRHDLASLSATCHQLRKAVDDHLGYRHVAVSDPIGVDQPSKNSQIGTGGESTTAYRPEAYQNHQLAISPTIRPTRGHSEPPPRISPQSSAVIENKVFVPILDGELFCYVFDVQRLSWTNFPLKITPNHQGDQTSTSLLLITTSITACPEDRCLYIFGGLQRRPSSTGSISLTKPESMDSASPDGHMSSVESPKRDDPESTIESPGAATSSTSEEHSTGESGNTSAEYTASSDLTPGDDSTGLHLSSALYRLDIPHEIFDAKMDLSSSTWKLWFLGDRVHRDIPIPSLPLLRDADGAVTPSSPLSNLNLEEPPNRYPSHVWKHSPTKPHPLHTTTTANSTSGSMTRRTSRPQRTSQWPSPRRDHTINCINGYLVIFGGMVSPSEGQDDIWAWDVAQGGWEAACRQVRSPQQWPREVYRHCSAVLGDSVYFYGGCMTNTPLIVFDNLFRLSCIGSPAEWKWILYKSPALYNQPKQAESASITSEQSDSASIIATSASASPSGSGSRGSAPGAMSRGAENKGLRKIRSFPEAGIDPHTIPEAYHDDMSDSVAATQYPASTLIGPSTSTGEHSPTHTGSSQTSTSGTGTPTSFLSRQIATSRRRMHSDGLSTSGDIPIERFGAALVPLGDRRLAVFGGLTVEEGMEESGMVFDEFCATRVTAIDIFDIPRLHWTAIRPSKPPANENSIADVRTLHGDFFLETCAVPIPPNGDHRLWSMLVIGKALDLRGYHIDDTQPLLIGESGGNAALGGAASHSYPAESIVVEKVEQEIQEPLILFDGDDGLIQSGRMDPPPANIRMEPDLTIDATTSKVDKPRPPPSFDGAISSVRLYHRSGSICSASTFSHRPNTLRPVSTNSSGSSLRSYHLQLTASEANDQQKTMGRKPEDLDEADNRRAEQHAILYPFPEGVYSRGYDGFHSAGMVNRFGSGSSGLSSGGEGRDLRSVQGKNIVRLLTFS